MNTEAVKQFLVGTVVPAIAGAGAAWLASKGVLNVFEISKATATTDLDELGVFLVVTGSGWLTAHHVLLGEYSPAAKATTALRPMVSQSSAPGAAPSSVKARLRRPPRRRAASPPTR